MGAAARDRRRGQGALGLRPWAGRGMGGPGRLLSRGPAREGLLRRRSGRAGGCVRVTDPEWRGVLPRRPVGGAGVDRQGSGVTAVPVRREARRGRRRPPPRVGGGAPRGRLLRADGSAPSRGERAERVGADPSGDGRRALMRVAALYDIHGNLPALEAVLEEVEGVDAVVVGGDVASGPMPAETLGALRSMGDRVHFVRGNADRVLDLDGIPEPNRSARLWVAEQLEEEALAFLANLPLGLALDVDGLGAVRFCHGAPGSDEEPITRATPDERLRGLLAGIGESVVVCGHTHVQFDRTVDGVRVVNAGSVGAPYEARLGAYWLLAGPSISLRRTPYDVHAAAERIRATGYPNLAYLDELVMEDPSRPERMSALIEQAV